MNVRSGASASNYISNNIDEHTDNNFSTSFYDTKQSTETGNYNLGNIFSSYFLFRVFLSVLNPTLFGDLSIVEAL